MLSLAVVFVQASFNLLALSTYPVLVCFLHCLLNPPIRFPVFFCSFCFIPLLLQVSPLITEVENIFGDPRRFPAMFLPKYPIGCISHCCIVGGNHGIDVHVLISKSKEWCEFPTYCCLKSASHIWVPQTLVLAGLAFSPSSDGLGRSSSPGHGHVLCLLQ